MLGGALTRHLIFTMSNHDNIPELLSPAGSPEAFEAAVAAGADAVYVGGTKLNARMNAQNFDRGALCAAVQHAHRHGVRVYVTLNTLVWDRELTDALAAANEAAEAGVDALIIADPGAAAVIRRALPGLPLHASTQLSGHNARMGEVLAPMGFSRFVIARETSLADLATAVRENPLEVEVFIHGALCVSHSGQCLFSSFVGGRSGNRGACAQPCRLPYACGRRGAEGYPLSLKDLSLAGHVPALIEAGVASLKIEGRMKSPGYVGGVTAIWRRLLDERRAATPGELQALADLFSRDGFTDGYQTGRIDRRMMGVRSDADKSRTAMAEKAAMAAKYPPRLPVESGFFAAPGEPVHLTATAPLYRQGGTDPHMGSGPSTVTVTVTGDIPAVTEQPTSILSDAVERQMARTGGTPYTVQSVGMHIRTTEDGLSPTLPLSHLNALRREMVAALDEARAAALPSPAAGAQALAAADITAVAAALLAGDRCDGNAPSQAPLRSARFRTALQITEDAAAFFDRLYLPLGQTHPDRVPADHRGVVLPPVVFDHDAEAVVRALRSAVDAGVRHILVGNLGHLPPVREAVADGTEGVVLHADFRLNPANALTAARLLGLGFADMILAPELTIPRMRDIGRTLSCLGAPGVTAAIVYGRLPLMLLEKCAIREVYRDRDPASVCRDICRRDGAELCDRMGKRFPILREDAPDGRGHRNSVYNALPLSMSDRAEELAGAVLCEHHFLFSVESAEEVDGVIRAFRLGRPLGGEVRRMPR